jgi:hypothetical protein
MFNQAELSEAMHLLGFFQVDNSYSLNASVGCHKISANARISGQSIVVKYWIDNQKIQGSTSASSIEDMILAVEEKLGQYGWSAFEQEKSSFRRFAQNVFAAINTSDLASRLFRVKSSNVWAYRLFMRDRKDKTGDLIVQFKARNGGPGDIYQYYDVPFTLFRRWQATTSKGHFFWKYIRNYYRYSKLTGDKIGRLQNAVNNIVRRMPNIQFMLKYVSDYVSGLTSREEFCSDLLEYWDMAKDDMASEDTDFTRAFESEIVDIVRISDRYDDDILNDLIKRNIRSVRRILQ